MMESAGISLIFSALLYTVWTLRTRILSLGRGTSENESSRGFAGLMEEKLKPRANRSSLPMLMERAGMNRSDAPKFLFRQMTWAAIGGCIGLSLTLTGSGFIWIVVLGSLAFFHPRLQLHVVIQRRQTKITFSLPYYLDLLTLALEAGLDLIAAVEEVVSKDQVNPLRDELLLALKSIRMGRTRSAAFSEMAQRTGVEALSLLATTIKQSEELGSSLGGMFRLQSEALRSNLCRIAEERAQKAPVKMLLPLVTLIFPVVMILLFVPLIMRMTGSF